LTDNRRLLELRRRVQADPASIAFAQLAEECRRSGATDEAVRTCRAGLAHHPGYLSARVTLGRALIELGRLEEAQAELALVLAQAPDNLPANRAIAELFQKRGRLPDALTYFKRALELARHDPELEQQIERITNILSPPVTSPRVEPTPKAVEDLFDFDTLLAQLGGLPQPPAEAPATTSANTATPSPIVPGEVEAVHLADDDSDPFSVLERHLRESPVHSTPLTASTEDDLERQRDQQLKAELEHWLSAIVADREQRPSA
jgi:tetratricopeptide (TPR) repeat protein